MTWTAGAKLCAPRAPGWTDGTAGGVGLVAASLNGRLTRPGVLPEYPFLFAPPAMPDTATPAAVRVCASTELHDGGLGVKLPVTDGDGRTTVFFVRYQGQVYGYLNRCAHVGVELDWENSFFTRAGDLLMCARHGATYQPDTGLCVGGPCKNSRLAPLPVQEREGSVYWLPSDRIRPVPPDNPAGIATGPA